MLADAASGLSYASRHLGAVIQQERSRRELERDASFAHRCISLRRRDPALPSFAGRYLYGRYESGIYALGPRASGKAIKTQARIESMTSFGEDALGRLYATSYNGAVYRLAETRGSLSLTKIGEFARPVSVVSPPGDAGQLFIVEKRGRVQLLAGGR